jgi:superkiller protein 3
MSNTYRSFLQAEAELEFASYVFSGLSGDSNPRHTRSHSFDALFHASFVLDRYCKKRPNDASALHLSGLINERIGHLEVGRERISQAISILEAVYEETEDPAVERQFTIATSNLARLKLSLQDYEGAIESFESVLGLLSEDGGDGSTIILRAQAQFGSGLANFKLGDLEGAMAMFEAALESAGDHLVIKGQVTVLLAQTMWAIGTEDIRDSAKAQLLAWLVYFIFVSGYL